MMCFFFIILYYIILYYIILYYIILYYIISYHIISYHIILYYIILYYIILYYNVLYYIIKRFDTSPVGEPLQPSLLRRAALPAARVPREPELHSHSRPGPAGGHRTPGNANLPKKKSLELRRALGLLEIHGESEPKRLLGASKRRNATRKAGRFRCQTPAAPLRATVASSRAPAATPQRKPARKHDITRSIWHIKTS